MVEEPKEKSETSEEIIKDIEQSGVPEEVDEKEEKLDEKAAESQASAALRKTAEEESTKVEVVKSIEERKKEILEKVKKLKGKVEKTKTEELKERVKIKKRADMLVPLEEYVKAGIYLGTKVVTPAMRPFVYRRRADGLAIFNTDLIDEKLKEGIEYLSKFSPEDVILVCKRQAGWKVAEMFGKLTGIRIFTQKYPAGILTNKQLPNFFENELTVITDQWIDKNALNDTLRVNKKVLMICDTNNFSKGANQVIIGNNKSPRSLGLIFYLLTRGYCKARKINADIPELEWWTGEKEEEGKRQKLRPILAKARTRFGV